MKRIVMPTYDCLACGACCKVFGIVELTANDDVPQDFRVPTELGYDRMRTVDFVCACLEHDNKCAIYERRPEVCRRFQNGGELCEMARQRHNNMLTISGGREKTDGQ